MAFFADQLGRSVELLNAPKRIVSLVPSQTELLFDLGLNDKVVGITKFCVHPEGWYRTKKRIGGTKQLHIDEIKELTPDLIIANKEENVRDQIEELAKDFPVWISDVNNLDSASSMITGIGEITSRKPQAKDIIHQIQADRKGLIWVNVSNNDPRLSMDGVIVRIRPDYKHTHFANVHGIHTRDKDGVYTF